MMYSEEQLFLSKFIFESGNCSNPLTCHMLIVREHTLRLVPCHNVRDDDVQIFRLMPQELTSGITRNRWIALTDNYIRIKVTMVLNDHGGKNGPEPKNTNDN